MQFWQFHIEAFCGTMFMHVLNLIKINSKKKMCKTDKI